MVAADEEAPAASEPLTTDSKEVQVPEIPKETAPEFLAESKAKPGTKIVEAETPAENAAAPVGQKDEAPLQETAPMPAKTLQQPGEQLMSLARDIVTKAIQQKWSDIHLEPEPSAMSLRYFKSGEVLADCKTSHSNQP
ncbi:MAG: hypothetical protein HC888_15430, partial [Candidatus Competibacteraceae bacterium]|nr:hypothetical protein [Candidatus Competibacteraceae bacterium]